MQPGATARAGIGVGPFLLLLMLSVTDASGTVRLVRPDGVGDYPTIQAALDASASADTVLLASGTFTGAGNRDLNFQGRAVVLASQEQSADACILDVQASPNAPHRGFFFASGEGAGTAVEALTITHAYAPVGGAALMLAASPSFRRVAFVENSSATAGAVYVLNGSPVFEDCVFRGNVIPAGSGGALYCKFGGAPRLSGCKFFDNQARFGGAVYCRENASPTFEHCLWVGNRGHSGGAFMGADGTLARITDNTFDSNRGSMGGAIDLEGGADVELTRCELSRNEAHRGGGLASWNSAPTLTECLFTENRAYSWGGGVYADSGTVMRLVRCTVVSNDAGWDGGGIGVLEGQVDVDHCTLSGNAALDSLGGGVSARGGFAVLTLRGAIVAFSRSGRAVYCGGGAQVSVRGSDLFGNAGGDYVGCVADLAGTEGNLSGDPRFCHQGGREFMLDEDSPCATRVEAGYGVVGAWDVGCDLGDGRADVLEPGPIEAPAFALDPGHPNPFHAGTVLDYALPERSSAGAVLEILDCAGRRVRTLDLRATSGQIAWDGRDARGAPVAAGVYLARLRCGDRTATRPLLRIR